MSIRGGLKEITNYKFEADVSEIMYNPVYSTLSQITYIEGAKE